MLCIENQSYFLVMTCLALCLGGFFLWERRNGSRAWLRALPEKTLGTGLFLGSLLLYLLLNNGEYVYYNNYSYLAEALLRGRLYVDGMPEYLESVQFAGHTYMHFAPGPSLLCLPFVLLFGVGGFNIAYLSMLLGAGNTVLFYRVFRNLRVGRGRREQVWCAVMACFGTVHAFLGAVGHSWFLGHVSSWFFLLLGMVFLTRRGASRKKDVFLSGLFYGLAVTCRMANLPGGVFFAGYVFVNREKKEWLRDALLFAAGAAVFGGLYMLYDYARFGTIMDKGYNLTHMKDMHRELYNEMQQLPSRAEQLAFLRETEKVTGGPLSLKHVRYNLYSIFLLPPEFTAESPYVIPTLAGVCLSILSPGLYFALRAPCRRDPLCRYLLAAAVFCAVPFLMNYGNGFAQFGMRYAMDFLPYVCILAGTGLTRKPLNGAKKALILLCVLLNLWGPVYWRFFYL